MERASAAEWAKRVARWKASGLTAKEFAAETGVNASTLSNWGWKLSRGSGGGGGQREHRSRRVEAAESMAGERRVRPPARGPGFIELPAVEVAAARPELEVVVGKNVRIRIPPDVDEASLGRLLRAVGVSR